MQTDLFPVESDWRPPDLSTLPQSWEGIRRVAVDVETKDEDLRELGPGVRRDGHIVGVALALEGVGSWYLPTKHLGGDNLDHSQVMSYITENMNKFDGDIVGANLSYDLDYLMEEGFEPHQGHRFRDVQIAEPLLNELRFSYSLDNILKEWGFSLKEKTLMLEAARRHGMKKDADLGGWIHKLPARYVGAYGERDVAAPLELIAAQEAEIDRQGLRQIYDLETEVLPILVKMRRLGVRIDWDQVQKVENIATRRANEAAGLITSATGITVTRNDFAKKELLVRCLKEIGIDFSMSDSLDKDWLKAHSARHPVIAAIQDGRKWDKVNSTFVASLRTHAVGDRIHCSFNQLRADRDDERGVKGAAYGRLSCEKPNMQQAPARDPEIGPEWRKCFLPEEGALWAAKDYSQQEPRMLAHCSEIVGVPGGAEAAQRYRDNPDLDNHDMMTEMVFGKAKEDCDPKVWKKNRGDAKIIFLGLCYNKGEVSLCADLGLPTKVIKLRNGRLMTVAGDEGKALFGTFHARVPMVRKMQEWCDERARDRGYITTILGRRCRFPKDDDGLNWKWTHKALNRLIQGSSADQTKMALVAMSKAGNKFMHLQVHDEIDSSVGTHEEAVRYAEIMKTCVPLNVPSKVDVEVGPSWGEAK